MKQLFRIALLAVAAIFGLTSTVTAQFAPGQQPTLFVPYAPPAQTFTAASQTGTVLATSALKSGVIEVNGSLTATVAAPVITGTTTSIATYTITTSTDNISGTIRITPLTLVPCVITFTPYSTLTTMVTQFNANSTCHTTDGITASTSTNTFILTQGGSSLTLTDNGSVLTEYKAWTSTWNIQGSIDGGVTWVNLPTAALPGNSPTLPLTGAAVVIPETTAVSTGAQSASGSYYVVSLAGFNRFQFVTTSASFTATSITIRLQGTAAAGYL